MTTPRVAPRRAVGRWAASAISAVAAATVLIVVFPAVTGATWSSVGQRLLQLSAPQVGVLSAVWLAGLFAHTFVMTGALPRLAHGQAMFLNFTGSAVSNVVPFGGALGMGLNYRMLRSWGFTATNFAVLVVLTNVWSTAAKLLLPSLALGGLIVSDELVSARVIAAALFGAAAALVAVVAFAAIASRANARASLHRAAARLMGGRRRVAVVDAARDALGAVGGGARAGVRRHWFRMTLGTVAYAGLQALLLYLCFAALGTRVDPVVVFAGYAMARVVSLVPITPAGLGLSETGSAAVLVALGTEPTVTAAAVVLYTTFTFVLEIPVGAAGIIAWWIGRGRREASTSQGLALG